MKVSVLIPLYNKSGYIASTIASVQNQTWDGEIELVIYDDGSTDNSYEVALEATKGYTRGNVILLPEEKNRGTAHAINMCDWAATGDVRFLLGADDLCHTERIERQMKMLEETKALIVDSYLVYEGERKNYLVKPHLPDSKRAMASQGKNPMNGGTMAWRRKLRDMMEGKDGYFFNDKLRHAEDIEFAIRAVKYTPAYCCPHILYTARRGGDNKTAWSERGEKMPQRRKEDLAIIEQVRAKLYGSTNRKKGMFL